MKILLINYHHFIYGGPDRYFFNIKAALEEQGHEVIPFAFNYEETLASPYRKYFPEPITGRGPCLLAKQHLSVTQKIKAVTRLFHNGEVENKFREVVRETRPDLVYSIYLSSSMLPKILKIAKREFGLPVLYRLSDFHMMCGSYLFFRDGHVCTECLKKPWSIVRNRCMQGSKLASLLRALQMRYVSAMGWYKHVDAFLCPSQIMQRYLVQHVGFESSKVRHLPTFTSDLGGPENTTANPYMLYFGKVTPEKGVEPLVKAYNQIPNPRMILKLVGAVANDYKVHLFALLDDKHRGLVEIDGAKQGDELWSCIRQCRFVVQPALWFENMPNTFLESMAAGKPIIASDIGSLPELVRKGENGMLVPPGDVDALAKAMQNMMDSDDLARLGASSRAYYQQDHTREVHMERLAAVMTEVTGR
jgi:glycosyltransferase involved in cell wall biosynthesis